MALKDSEITARIQEEHEYLKKEMKKMRTMMKRDISAAEFPKWRLEFLWLLRDFYNDMQKHFDLEEEGGFMKDVMQVAPQKAKSVQKLEEEHRELAEKLNGVIERVKKMDRYDQAKLKRIFKSVDDLLLTLANHEASERDIIETTYLIDYGAGD